jgi:polyhydroxyalkanoate synthase
MYMLVFAVAAALAQEVHRVPTADGAEIVLEHHATPGGPPVVLCHGISSNHFFWDLEPGRSLALYLQERGYDVWNMDLRGHGSAEVDGNGKKQRPGWTVDDYGQQDLPAAFAYVLEKSGQAKLHYVGHSMGGMVLAVYLATHPDPPLSSAVVVGSPLDFHDPDVVTATLLAGAPVARAVPFLPSPMGARALLAFDTSAPLEMDAFLYNPDNIAKEARKLMLARVVSPLSRGEVGQFGLALEGGEFVSADGAVVYRERLGGVRIPMLFFAGRADHVVNPDRVKAYFDAVGSPEKEFVMLSVANGFHGDYGHLDMGVGDHADDDVFAGVAAWLAAHP